VPSSPKVGGRDGAPIQNATVHGLYARRLSQQEWNLLGEVPAESVEGEIALQRALIGRLAGVLANNGLGWSDEDELPEEARKTMKLMNETMGRLLGYIRVHLKEVRRLNDPTGEIEAGKNLARKERNVFDYLAAQDHADDADDAG
jgi:hypothetical protein